MPFHARELPLVDTGLAATVYVTGLGAVEWIDGHDARFMFYVNRGEGADAFRDVVLTLIAPAAAVGPAVDLCIQRLGSGVLVPVLGPSLRRMMC